MSEPRKILLNGREHETTAADIAALVAELGFAPGTILVEWNTIALRPSEWTQLLSSGDRLELMRIAAGG